MDIDKLIVEAKNKCKSSSLLFDAGVDALAALIKAEQEKDADDFSKKVTDRIKKLQSDCGCPYCREHSKNSY